MVINHPVLYHRRFDHDLPIVKSDPPEDLLKKSAKRAMAIFPLFSLIPSFRGPMTPCLGVTRAISHLASFAQSLKSGEYEEAVHHLLQTSFAVTSVVLTFFMIGVALVISSTGDLIFSFKELIEAIRANDPKDTIEALMHILLDTLFIGSILFGAIELTVACMVVQILCSGYQSLNQLSKGNIFEAVCAAIFAGASVKNCLSQIKLLRWKYSHDWEFEATLKQDERGFVYLDIPDEKLHELYALYKEEGMEIPPYFGPRKPGAHVSVILSEEWRKHYHYKMKISEIGEKVRFRMHGVQSVKPHGWDSVNKVYFVTLHSPELAHLREKYGFSSRIAQDHDFHFTFAKS